MSNLRKNISDPTENPFKKMATMAYKKVMDLESKNAELQNEIMRLKLENENFKNNQI